MKKRQTPTTNTPILWLSVWKMALVPSSANYMRLAGYADRASIRLGALWISLSALATFLAFILRTLLLHEESVFPRSLGAGLLVAGFGILLLLSEWILFTGSAHLASRLLGGIGRFRPFSFAFASFMAPLSAISELVSIISVILGAYVTHFTLPPALIWLPFGLWYVVSSIVAINTFHKFSWAKSLIAALPIIGLVGLILVWTQISSSIISVR